MPYGKLHSRVTRAKVPPIVCHPPSRYQRRDNNFLSDIAWPPNAIPQSLLITDIQRIGTSAWQFTWDETTGPYQIFLRGQILLSVTTATVILDISSYEDNPPPIEVLDATMGNEVAQGWVNPAYVVIQWVGAATSAYYNIEKYVGATWVKQDTVTETGAGYYNFQTAEMDAETQWRVVPVDASNNEGTPVAYTILLITNEDPPNAVDISYSGGTVGAVVIGG